MTGWPIPNPEPQTVYVSAVTAPDGTLFILGAFRKEQDAKIQCQTEYDLVSHERGEDGPFPPLEWEPNPYSGVDKAWYADPDNDGDDGATYYVTSGPLL